MSIKSQQLRGASGVGASAVRAERASPGRKRPIRFNITETLLHGDQQSDAEPLAVASGIRARLFNHISRPSRYVDSRNLRPYPARYRERFSDFAASLLNSDFLGKVVRALLIGLCATLLAGFQPTRANAAITKLLIRVLPESGRVVVEGGCASSQAFSFRDSYADVLGLGGRISEFRLFDSNGTEVQVHRIAPGQYDAATAASAFRYQVNLAPPSSGSEAAKVSWLNAERGLLMLGDLLPVQTGDVGDKRAVATGAVRFELPLGWGVSSNEKRNRTAEYEIADSDAAVFVIGSRLRTLHSSMAGTSVNLVIDGDWAFTDSEASELILKVLKGERDVFGAMPARQTTFILLPFQSLIADKWSAETRGQTVTLLLGKIPSKIGALAQLSTPLMHESFHLWIPNALALEGDYDWFYEGFTVYEAARVAVHLDLLMFPEFLRAMARAYDAYLGSTDKDRWSLVEYSKRRWTGGQSAVYQKSMLVAFLYDLKLRRESKSKRSLDDIYREIIKEYLRADAESAQTRVGEANDVVLRTLVRQPGMSEFGESFIERPFTLDLEKELAPFGLTVERVGLRARLGVSEKLDKQQRDLLRQLGYNDVTRSGHER